jgi:transcriptional regulator with XRE-family HTH domain
MAIQYEATIRKFGERIEVLRKSKGMTQEELAAKADISHAYYWSIIRNGRNVTIKTALNLANSLGVSLDDLFKR